jgi:hypothetical protein
VPVEDLRNLVSILTLENCSEGTYKNATHVLQQLSANALNRYIEQPLKPRTHRDTGLTHDT